MCVPHVLCAARTQGRSGGRGARENLARNAARNGELTMKNITKMHGNKMHAAISKLLEAGPNVPMQRANKR